ncbi:MAG TPA: PASTA domain-containing protein, partial [Actinomycetota bacterium]
VLGANEVNTLEMASAYGTLAAGGLRVPPVAIERVTDAGGRLLYSARPEPREVVSPAVAWVVTQILRKVILYGTGISANIGRPAAGKTGTAQQWRDAWFVGFIPQLVAGVWVGFPRAAISMVPPKTRLRVTGGSFPAQIWHAFMMKATRDMPVQNFEKPRATQVSVAVDTARGCLADELSLPGDIETITFVAGTQPKRCRDGSVVNGVPQSGVGVPTVVGMPVDAAVSLLVEKGYTTSSEEEYHAGYPQGTVIRQYPVGGIAAPSGTRVHLVVSTQAKPYVVVPKVKGLAQAQARAKLEAAGFAVAILTASSMKAGYGPGIVVSQSPKGGSERPEGSTVTITVNPSASPAPSPT